MNIQAEGIKTFNPAMRPLNIGVPNKVTIGAAAAATTVYDCNKNQKIEKMFIQNVGTGTAKICLNDNATTDLYHYLLAAGTASEDGLGSAIEIDAQKLNVTKITVFSTAGTVVNLAPQYNAYSSQRVNVA